MVQTAMDNWVGVAAHASVPALSQEHLTTQQLLARVGLDVVESMVGDAIMGCSMDLEMFMANEMGSYIGGQIANPVADYMSARQKVPVVSSQQIKQDSLAPHDASYLMASAAGQGKGKSPDFLGLYPGAEDPDDLLNYLLNIQSISNQPAVQMKTQSQITQQMLKQQGNAARMQGIPVDYLKAMKAAEGFMSVHPAMMQTAEGLAAVFGVVLAADVIGVGLAAGVGTAVAPLQKAAVKFTNMAENVGVSALVASQFFGVGEAIDVVGGIGLAADRVVIGTRTATSVAAKAMERVGFFSNGARVAESAAKTELRSRILFNIAESRAAREVTGFPVLSAKIDQISGGYLPDAWEMTTLHKGDIVFGGLPGQSIFYTDEATVLASHGDTQLLSESLQIEPHPIKGYRENIGQYTVQKDIRIPVGIVKSNSLHGSGGGQQFFIKFYSNQLSLTDELSLEQYYANQMSRNYFRP